MRKYVFIDFDGVLNTERHHSELVSSGQKCSDQYGPLFAPVAIMNLKRIVDELPGMQKTIYDELPQSFETRTGLVIAERCGMPERTFKRWLSTTLFRKITHGFYEKRYR